MDTLTQLQQNRRIIHDLTLSTLSRIASPFSRLAYLAPCATFPPSIRACGLSAVYPDAAVRQALEQCHQELFERIRNTFGGAGTRLRAHLRTLPNGSRRAAAQWRRLESYRGLLPAESPEYLKELLLECACHAGDSRERAFNGTGSWVAILTTHPQFPHIRNSKIPLTPAATSPPSPAASRHRSAILNMSCPLRSRVLADQSRCSSSYF